MVAPYNYFSPKDENSPGGYDGKVPNGCVAVAMAQIAYYYRYPEFGSGSHRNAVSIHLEFEPALDIFKRVFAI